MELAIAANVRCSIADSVVNDGETKAPESESDDVSGTTGNKSSDESGPGVGIGSALTGISGAAHFLKRRLTDEETNPT